MIIAGERSGVGKTTVTLAILSYLCRYRGYRVQSFKVGPDYIDPMFHTYVTGRPCRNLDPILTDEQYVKTSFARYGQEVEYILIEGVMGLFDGGGKDKILDFGSSAHVARILKKPVILVIDCGRLSISVAAIIHGYRSYDSKIKLAGVILNKVGSDRHLDFLQMAIAPLNVPILGVLRRQSNLEIPSRHLGLIPTAELTNLNSFLDELTEIAKVSFDWDRLLPLLKSNKNLTRSGGSILQIPHGQKVKIAIARDSAFSFYYQDNLDMLEFLGAELIPWSPQKDQGLPCNVHGLYFGGGFPEMFAVELSENKAAKESVKKAIIAGIPTYAECGGLMYLCQELIDFKNNSWSMVRVLPTRVAMTSNLVLGYRKAIALRDTPLLMAKTTVWGHEFHRSAITMCPSEPIYQTQLNTEGWYMYQVHASYIHLHWGANPEIPTRFIRFCLDFAALGSKS